MSVNDLRIELSQMRESLERIEKKMEKMEDHLNGINLGVTNRVVRLETQMKIVVGVLGASSIAGAGFLGFGG